MATLMTGTPSAKRASHGTPHGSATQIASRKKAVLTYTEELELIRVLQETWRNVIKICRVFGVRSWEVAFISIATNDDGEPQLRVTKGKTYNTSGGVKEETDPR